MAKKAKRPQRISKAKKTKKAVGQKKKRIAKATGAIKAIPPKTSSNKNENLSVSEQPVISAPLKAELILAVDKWSSAFWRIRIPSNLLSSSTVNLIKDESAYVISAKLFYGMKTGKKGERPYDHGEVNKITDLSKESLWMYYNKENQAIPPGFKESKQDTGYISVGNTYKCYRCKGLGRRVCLSCNGTGQVRRTDSNNRHYWDTCRSCDGGYNQCYKCAGYGWLQEVIETVTEYRTSSHTDVDYKGSIPADMIQKASGYTLLEEVFDYPLDKAKAMLVGGINPEEFQQLHEHIKDQAHFSAKAHLGEYEGDVKLLFDSIETFFAKMPNPINTNVVFEREILPVRIQLKVEHKSTHRVDFSYKSSNYSINIYGDENSVHYHQGPNEHTPKATYAYLGIALCSIAALVFFVISNT